MIITRQENSYNGEYYECRMWLSDTPLTQHHLRWLSYWFSYSDLIIWNEYLITTDTVTTEHGSEGNNIPYTTTQPVIVLVFHAWPTSEAKKIMGVETNG